MTKRLVSVIVPTYNRAHCIARAIDSALGQTHEDLEVVVVDDGSKDGTDALFRGRYSGAPRVRYLPQPNRGVSAARNRGLREARGEFVAFLDSDDTWCPWKVELELACLDALPTAGMVWTDMTARRTDGSLVTERYLRTYYGAYRLFSTEELFDVSLALRDVAPRLAQECGAHRVFAGDLYGPMVMGNLVHTSTVLLRRERARAAGFFDESVRSGEDHEFHLATCRAGRVAYADVPTIDYEIGADDALSRDGHNVPMARHFLRVLERELAGHRDRIRVPEGTIAHVRADAHRWLGESLLGHDEAAEGRRHLVASLRIEPRQRRVALLLAASLLPPGVRRGLGRTARRVRSLLRD